MVRSWARSRNARVLQLPPSSERLHLLRLAAITATGRKPGALQKAASRRVGSRPAMLAAAMAARAAVPLALALSPVPRDHPLGAQPQEQLPLPIRAVPASTATAKPCWPKAR